MEELDLVVRRRTYGQFVELGRAPSAAEAARDLDLTEEQILASWRRLHDAHALVLNPVTPELRMANPFSAVPTAYRVEAGGRSWYGNCAWDALGICAALGADGRIETSCPDCGAPIEVEVRGRRLNRDDLLFHCLVPAARWWDDIVFT